MECTLLGLDGYIVYQSAKFLDRVVLARHRGWVNTVWLTLLFTCLAAPSAWARKVEIEYDHEADFSQIRHYQWRTHPIFEKNPELRDIYSVGIQLVLQAGNEELPKRGLQPADSSPDVFVTFFLIAKGAESVRTSIEPGWWSVGYGWYTPPAWTITEIEHYLEGMLVLDIVDAHTSKLLWRAYCSDQIRDMTERHKNVNDTVKKALDRYPPKKK